ncbi:MAG: zinc carboxypeptidase [Candidatus Thermoplasmatota archaeon]|nr:zinc carboxypeptidase [Candidatus Thermoplasmatota archaeon]
MKPLFNLQYKKLLLFGFIFILVTSVPFSRGMNDHSNHSIKTSLLDAYHYHTYQEMTDELHLLQVNYSEIMSLTSIGRTSEGRDIWMVKLSDNVSQQEEEPGVLLMGAHHGNEKPSYEVCLFFIRYIVEQYENASLPEIRTAVDSTQIYLIPMVNPDGVEANTRKNCAPNHGPFGLSSTVTSYGVNLNRNYGDLWFLSYLLPTRYSLPFILPDSSFNYRGPYPFSENETKAVKNFVETHQISISISYHTYGEFIVYPWMHTTKQTPDEPLFRSVGENITLFNDYYLYVKKDRLIPLYGGTLGSSENWLYRSGRIIAFTVELCRERAPSNPQVVSDLCMTHTRVHLYLCQRAQTIESEKASI